MRRRRRRRAAQRLLWEKTCRANKHSTLTWTHRNYVQVFIYLLRKHVVEVSRGDCAVITCLSAFLGDFPVSQGARQLKQKALPLNFVQ